MRAVPDRGAHDHEFAFDPMLITFGASFVGVLIIAPVFMFIGRMHFLERRDAAGLDFLAGIAVAYVFVDILPHLAAKQNKLAKAAEDGGLLTYVNFYVLTLVGFLFFLHILLGDQWRGSPAEDSGSRLRPSPFVKVQVASQAIYTAMIGYMLAEQATHRIESALVFAIAMAAHFAGIAHVAHHRTPQLYDSFSRWLFVVAVTIGWVLGILFEFSGLYYGATFAFLAGGIIIVTAVFELPRITSTRHYLYFCLGAAAFTSVALIFEFV